MPLAAYADFDSSLTIDFDDLTRFVAAWYAKDYSQELGPSTGTMPHLLMEPDGDFSGRDLITFIRMWDWYSQYASPLAKATGEVPVISPDVSYEQSKLLIRLDKVKGLAAVHVQFTYPQDKVQLALELSDTYRYGLQLQRFWSEIGIAEFDLGLPAHTENDVEIQLRTEIQGRDAINVGIYIEAVDQKGRTIGQGETTIEVLPIPTEFALHQNYPNPFNPNTTIRYDLPKAGDVTLIVYDLLGREVVRLVDGYVEAGYYQVEWSGTSNLGQGLSTGIYFVRMATAEYSRSFKLLLLK